MAKGQNLLRTLVYITIGIILIAIALKVVGFILNLTLQLVATLFSLVFVVGILYAIYAIFRAVCRSK